MTDEMMAERRQLFLEEMARIREREGQTRDAEPREAPSRTSAWESALVPSARPSVVARQQSGPLVLMLLCLVLVFPIWRYIQHQTALHPPPSFGADSGEPMPDSPEWRLARLQRVRAHFGLADIVAVSRDQNGFVFVLRPGLSHERILAQARHIRSVLSGHIFPPRGPQAGQISVCSGDQPCLIAVVQKPGPGGVWDVVDGRQISK